MAGESCDDDAAFFVEVGGDCTVCHWVTARCIASSASCDGNWAGPTAAHIMLHASMI